MRQVCYIADNSPALIDFSSVEAINKLWHAVDTPIIRPRDPTITKHLSNISITTAEIDDLVGNDARLVNEVVHLLQVGSTAKVISLTCSNLELVEADYLFKVIGHAGSPLYQLLAFERQGNRNSLNA